MLFDAQLNFTSGTFCDSGDASKYSAGLKP